MPTTAAAAVRSEREGDVVTITLNRPEKRNALAVEVMIELTRPFARSARATPSG